LHPGAVDTNKRVCLELLGIEAASGVKREVPVSSPPWTVPAQMKVPASALSIAVKFAPSRERSARVMPVKRERDSLLKLEPQWRSPSAQSPFLSM
jgi:hypothetical protein